MIKAVKHINLKIAKIFILIGL